MVSNCIGIKKRVYKFLGYEFKHHDALYDALACSNIFLNISEELETTDINEISKLVGVTLGSVDNDGYKSSSARGRIFRFSSREPAQKDIREELNYDAFKDEVVVFTGGLASMARDEYMRFVRRLGGTCGSSVTKKATILVTNMQNIEDLSRDEMSNKLKKAVDLIGRGQKISFLNEEEFLKRFKIHG